MYRQRLQTIAREAGFPIQDYGDNHFVISQDVIGQLRELPYLERWRLALVNRWYHVRMQDHSLFLFSEGLAPSYSFLHCPIEVPSFADYLVMIKEPDTPQTRRLFEAKYEQVFDTSMERRHVTPIRFDYDPNSYRAGVHPVAHVHIGMENQVRLCANKMSAVSFTLFVMRQMYPRSWERLLGRSGRHNFVRSIRDVTTRLAEEFWTDLDRIELHLG